MLTKRELASSWHTTYELFHYSAGIFELLLRLQLNFLLSFSLPLYLQHPSSLSSQLFLCLSVSLSLCLSALRPQISLFIYCCAGIVCPEEVRRGVRFLLLHSSALVSISHALDNVHKVQCRLSFIQFNFLFHFTQSNTIYTDFHVIYSINKLYKMSSCFHFNYS